MCWLGGEEAWCIAWFYQFLWVLHQWYLQRVLKWLCGELELQNNIVISEVADYCWDDQGWENRNRCQVPYLNIQCKRRVRQTHQGVAGASGDFLTHGIGLEVLSSLGTFYHQMIQSYAVEAHPLLSPCLMFSKIQLGMSDLHGFCSHALGLTFLR